MAEFPKTCQILPATYLPAILFSEKKFENPLNLPPILQNSTQFSFHTAFLFAVSK